MRTSPTRFWTETVGCSQAELFPFAKGNYQQDVLAGIENLSGSTLRGKAARFKPAYSRSRTNLLKRIKNAGYEVSERKADHNARILVIRKN